MHELSIEKPLSVVEAQVRTVHRFSALQGAPWSWWGWKPAKISMVSGRLRLSESNETWQVSPYSMDLHGFTKIVVDGIDDEGHRRRLLVKFVNVGESWKFAENVPDLRWTYWNPTGQIEQVPVKIRDYRSPKGTALSVALTAVAIGFSIWLAFNFFYLGLLGTLTTTIVDLFLHPIVAPFQARRKSKTGYLLIDRGRLVITAGNMVYFDPTVSERRSRKPNRIVVEIGMKKKQVEFASANDAMGGLQLIRKSSRELGRLADIIQPA